MISELAQAICRASVTAATAPVYRFGGLVNTGWHRFKVSLAPSLAQVSPEDEKLALEGAQKVIDQHKNFPVPPFAENHPWKLNVQLLASNIAAHLEGLTRQKGGIGSTAYDSSQKSIKDFFSGGHSKSGSSSA